MAACTELRYMSRSQKEGRRRAQKGAGGERRSEGRGRERKKERGREREGEGEKILAHPWLHEARAVVVRCNPAHWQALTRAAARAPCTVQTVHCFQFVLWPELLYDIHHASRQTSRDRGMESTDKGQMGRTGRIDLGLRYLASLSLCSNYKATTICPADSCRTCVLILGSQPMMNTGHCDIV